MIIKKTDKKNTNKAQDIILEQESNITEKPVVEEKKPVFSFVKERQERRRGDRRRGYRRVDDRNLISRAHEEANYIKERSANEGFEYGLQESKEELRRILESIASLLEAKEDAMKKSSSDIAFLAVKVAEKIIKTEVACDETIVLSIVADVLKQIGKEESSIIIKTNPADTEIVRENMPKIFPYGSAHAKITVIDDNEVDQGSCIIETNNGMIDARFSTQIKIIEKAFQAGI